MDLRAQVIASCCDWSRRSGGAAVLRTRPRSIFQTRSQLSVAQICTLSVSVKIDSFRDDSLCSRKRRLFGHQPSLRWSPTIRKPQRGGLFIGHGHLATQSSFLFLSGAIAPLRNKKEDLNWASLPYKQVTPLGFLNNIFGCGLAALCRIADF